MSVHAAGRNTRAENLDTIAKATATPRMIALIGEGFSLHISEASNAAPKHPVSAMSVVTRPECAKTGGRVVKKKQANSPACDPARRFAHRNTTALASQKKGRMPSLLYQRTRSPLAPPSKVNPSYHMFGLRFQWKPIK